MGQRAAKLISLDPIAGQVLACFERAWNLVTTTGQICTLAWAGIPDGPSNILLTHAPGAGLPAGTRFIISGPRLHFIDVAGGRLLPIDLTRARIWDPRTDWHMLCVRRPQILARVPILASLLAGEAPLGSLANLITLPAGLPPAHSNAPTVSGAGSAATRHLPVAAWAIAATLRAWAAGDQAALAEAVTALCGLGPGLTPAGDDWLAGWLLALRLQPQAGAHGLRLDAACSTVMAVSMRTTRLSRAFLACAAAGEVDALWQALLDALVDGSHASVTTAASRILGQGATSGADMLAGFLMGLRQTERNST